MVAVLIFGFILFENNISNTNEDIIEIYDLVTNDYQMWESDYVQGYDPFNPLIDETIVVRIIPITEQDNGLILGLYIYNNLIGKVQYYESGFVWLDKYIDQNRDGLDDIITDRAALTYGNSTDQFFNNLKAILILYS
ncbi:hypothetical protein ES705_44555 [subsurface metagenome]